MAKKLLDAIAADTATDTVRLHCEDLGKTEDYEPAHAKALLALQTARGITGKGSWQPVAEEAAKAE